MKERRAESIAQRAKAKLFSYSYTYSYSYSLLRFTKIKSE